MKNLSTIVSMSVLAMPIINPMPCDPEIVYQTFGSKPTEAGLSWCDVTDGLEIEVMAELLSSMVVVTAGSVDVLAIDVEIPISSLNEILNAPESASLPDLRERAKELHAKFMGTLGGTPAELSDEILDQMLEGTHSWPVDEMS